MRKSRENIIVAKGNYGLFPAGEMVFNGDGSINVLPGQIVFYDPVTKKGLGPGTTVSDVDRIKLGVGCDTTGDGMADTIRMTFGDNVYGCNIDALTAEPPTCGLPAIKDLLFGDCLECGQNLSIAIHVEDDSTQNQYPYNKKAEYIYTASTGECGCDDCDDAVPCEQAVCALIDAINGTGPKGAGTFTGNKGSKLNRPKVKAVRLYEKS